MDLKISDKVALVTGSTQGIGFATAKLLAQEGVEVIVNGRNDKKVQEAVEKIKASVKDAKVCGVVADLGDAEGW